MGNLFYNLPLPVLNGVGAAVDVSAMGSPKTITCIGGFAGASIVIEISTDGGVGYVPIAVFQNTGSELVVPIAAQWMRTNVTGRKSTVPFSANVDVGATDAGSTFAILPLPVLNGPGTAVDISTFENFTTFVATGVFQGAAILVEISEDNLAWAALSQFSGQGGRVDKVLTANWARANVSGRNAIVPFTGGLSVGATAIGGGGGGSSLPSSTCLIYRYNSGLTGPVVFDTWAGLYAQLVAMRAANNGDGCYTIQFDNSTSAAFLDATIGAGTYDMTGCSWEGAPLPNAISGGQSIALLGEGAIFTNGPNSFKDMGVYAMGAVLPPPFTYDLASSQGFFQQITIDNVTLLANDVAVPVMLSDNGAVQLNIINSQFNGGNGKPVLWALNAGFINLKLEVGAIVVANSLVTDATGQFNYEFKAASAILDEDQPLAPGALQTVDEDFNRTWVRHFTNEIFAADDTAFFGYLNRFDASGAAQVTAQLPQTLSKENRYQWALLKETSGLPPSSDAVETGLTVAPFAGDTIDGVLGNIQLLPGAQIALVSDGFGGLNSAFKTAGVPEKVFASVVFSTGGGGGEVRIAYFNIGNSTAASGVVKNGTGDWTLTFNTPIPGGLTSWYPVVTISYRNTTAALGDMCILTWEFIDDSNIQILSWSPAGVAQDPPEYVSVSVSLARLLTGG